MQETFELNLKPRDDAGKGASRRLRREGMVPGIIYGGSSEPEMVAVEHNELAKHLEHEAFFSHILSVQVEGRGGKQNVVLKDLQRHPARPFVEHFDLQRVKMDEELRMTVPLHFLGEEAAAGIKMGGTLLRGRTEVEIHVGYMAVLSHVKANGNARWIAWPDLDIDIADRAIEGAGTAVPRRTVTTPAA